MNLIPDALKAPIETIAQRLATCRACEHRGEVPVLHTEFCKACGCPLASKTALPHSTCPKGKW